MAVCRLSLGDNHRFHFPGGHGTVASISPAAGYLRQPGQKLRAVGICGKKTCAFLGFWLSFQ